MEPISFILLGVIAGLCIILLVGWSLLELIDKIIKYLWKD